MICLATGWCFVLKVGVNYVRWSLCTQDERHICFELCTLCYDIPRRVVSNFVAGMYNVVCIAKGGVLFLCRE